jgi:hypothetical protein
VSGSTEPARMIPGPVNGRVDRIPRCPSPRPAATLSSSSDKGCGIEEGALPVGPDAQSRRRRMSSYRGAPLHVLIASFGGTVIATISSSARSRKPKARAAGRFCRVAVSPIFMRQSPADLDAGHEVLLEARDRQSDEADEVGDARRFHRPQTESVPSEVVTDPRGELIALSTVETPREELHQPRIRIEGRKGSEVVLTPRAQSEPAGLQDRVHAQSWTTMVVLGLASMRLGHPSGSPAPSSPA